MATQKIETITTDAKLPYVESGVLWHVDDLVAAWLCDRLKTEMPRIEYRAFGLVRSDTPDGIVRDLSKIYMVGGFLWYNYCDGQGGADHDITLAAAIDDTGFNTPRALRKLLEYPFGFLKVPRISVAIDETNEPALKQAERLGFRIEGIKRKAGSRGTDMVMLGLLPEECPFWTQA